MKYFNVLGISAVCALLFLSPQVSYGSQTCHTIRENVAPSGFGAPINFFNKIKNTLLVTAECSDTQAAISVGNGETNQYIYKYGYELVNNSWRKITLTGEEVSGLWFRGSAKSFLERTKEQMTTENKILVYICTKVDGKWKCGCKDEVCTQPHWTIQTFKVPEQGSVSEVTIDYIEPLVFEEGTQVTIHGKGFDSEKNSIYTPYFSVKNIPSTDNGTKITFTFKPAFTVFSLTDLYSEIDSEDTEGEPLEGELSTNENGTEDPFQKHNLPLPVVVQTPLGAKDVFEVSFLQNLFTE